MVPVRVGQASAWSRRRLALTLLLAVSWLILVPLLWRAFSTLPTPERLEQSRMAPIPTLQSFLFVTGKSALELGVVLVLTWPRAQLYASRLVVALLGLLGWFLFSTPLSVSRMEWLHRRWLALAVLALLVALVIELAVRLARRVARRPA